MCEDKPYAPKHDCDIVVKQKQCDYLATRHLHLELVRTFTVTSDRNPDHTGLIKNRKLLTHITEKSGGMALGLAISSCSDIRNRYLFVSCSAFPCWHRFQAGLPQAVEETATSCSSVISHQQKEKTSFLEFQLSPAS